MINGANMKIEDTLMPTDEVYRPLVIKMKSDSTLKEFWWEIREYCNDSFHREKLSKLPFSNCDSGVVLYTFSDKLFPFKYISALGIIGLYTTIVILLSRFIKVLIKHQHRKIMFKDLPNVDRIFQLCLDIYFVRENLEYKLEEDLFSKLIFLYRSPETMIKWTRPKEELYENVTDTERPSIVRREHQ